MDRRVFLQAAAGAASALAQDAKPLYSQVEKQHDENIRREQHTNDLRQTAVSHR